MRVGILSYPMLHQTSGGLRMKVWRTVDALNGCGVEARLVDPVRERLTSYDLIHVFAPYNGNHRVVMQAKSDGLPVVMSTILNPPFSKWDGRRARLLSRIVSRLTSWEVTTNYQDIVMGLNSADHLIALGNVEREMLIKGYGIPMEKISIVPNGIGPEFFESTPDLFENAYSVQHPFVLHTGFIGDVKNQLGLIRALKHVDVRIVLVGYSGNASKDYLAACLSEGGARLHYLGELAHGPAIASAYAAADVVAIPSRHEGMPNSILEALAADKPVVLTKNHSMDFELPFEVAREVDADDLAAIDEGVRWFLSNPPAKGRARSVVTAMTWDRVAAQLVEIYRLVRTRECPC